MKDYLETEADVVIVIVGRIVIDVGKTTVVGVTTDQPITVLEICTQIRLFTHCDLNTLAAVLYATCTIWYRYKELGT